MGLPKPDQPKVRKHIVSSHNEHRFYDPFLYARPLYPSTVELPLGVNGIH